MPDYVKCGECMEGAPYHWCCKRECGKREECQKCQADTRGESCPNTAIYIGRNSDEMEVGTSG